MTGQDKGSERLRLAQADQLCREAVLAAGASPEVAASLAAASVEAEALGQANVGLLHLLDYLSAIEDGRIDGLAMPELQHPMPAIVQSDAKGGIAQLGFDMAFERFAETAHRFGVAMFNQRNAFTCGCLGLFVSRLAERGLVGIAATNGPALMTATGAKVPVYCTNPIAFAAPVADGPPLLIDQASSSTAYVNVRKAAKENRPIPEGWAVDAEGRPTTDAAEALKGALLAFGGARGANIALMVEVLAAGLSGATWSLDAASFTRGTESPNTGLFVLALKPDALDADFPARLKQHLARLAELGIHIPGRSKGAAKQEASAQGLSIASATLERIRAFTRDRTTR